MDGQSCASCIYYTVAPAYAQRLAEDPGTKASEYGYCRRFPQHVAVQATTWCGEYKEEGHGETA